MKTTKKILLGSILTILLCTSMIVGATYALFTSESKNNVAITSGKVEVVANVVKDSLKLYSGSFNEDLNDYEYVEQSGHFVNGGSASFSEDEKLQLNNIAPLDKVSFDIALTNNSTIAIKYQVQLLIENDTKLFGALKVTLEGLKLVNNGKTNISKWSDSVMAGQKIDNLKVTIELPEGIKNDYQNEACDIAIVVYAVQSNAHTTNPVETDLETAKEVYIYNEDELIAFRDQVNSGDNFKNKTVYLMNDLNLVNVANWEPIAKSGAEFNGTFDGKDFTIYNLTVNKENEDCAGLFGFTTSAKFQNIRFSNVDLTSRYYAGALGGNLYTSSIENVHVENIKIHTSHWLGGIVGSMYGNITNCTVKALEGVCLPNKPDGASYDNGDKAGGIIGQLQDSGRYKIENCKVEDSTISAYRDLGGLVGCGTGSAKTYKNNVIKNVTLTIDRTNDYGNKEFNVGAVVGRNDSSYNQDDVFEKNEEENVTINYVNCDFAKNHDEWIVSSAKTLKTFASLVNSGTTFDREKVNLATNIDLENEVFVPIGNSEHPFKGSFDGKMHTIYNLVISGSYAENGWTTKENYGLFGATNGATISNLTVENANLSALSDSSSVGVVVGGAHVSKLDNVNIKGHVLVSGTSYVGGIVGKAYCNMESCHADVDETSLVTVNYQYGGGIIGFNGEGSYTISNCSSNMNLLATPLGYSGIGGIIGCVQYGTVVDSCTVFDITITISRIFNEEKDNEDNSGVGSIAGRYTHKDGDPVKVTIQNCTGKATIDSNCVYHHNGLVGVQKGYKEGTINEPGNLVLKNNTVIGVWNKVRYDENGKFYVDDSTSLVAFSEATNKGYFKKGEGRALNVFITKDINMQSVESFMPISAQWVNLDGQNHTISNLTCGMETTGKSGLFGYGGAAVIKDLTLENVTCKGSQAGAFMGHSADGGVLENCALKGSINIIYEQTSETYGGVGAFVGVSSTGNDYPKPSFTDLKILEGCTVKLVTTGLESLCMGTSKEGLLGNIVDNTAQPADENITTYEGFKAELVA